MAYCPIEQPVFVRDYERIRNGRSEHVRKHCRRTPKR